MKELKSLACRTDFALVVGGQGEKRSDFKDLDIEVDVGNSAWTIDAKFAFADPAA